MRAGILIQILEEATFQVFGVVLMAKIMGFYEQNICKHTKKCTFVLKLLIKKGLTGPLIRRHHGRLIP